MSYHAGIGEGLRALGLGPCPPHVCCDEVGCDAMFEAKTGRGGGPPAWLRDGKAPPGWRTKRVNDRRLDFCPKHSSSSFEAIASVKRRLVEP